MKKEYASIPCKPYLYIFDYTCMVSRYAISNFKERFNHTSPSVFITDTRFLV